MAMWHFLGILDSQNFTKLQKRTEKNGDTEKTQRQSIRGKSMNGNKKVNYGGEWNSIA